MVHVDADAETQGDQGLREDRFHAAAQGQGLRRIRLRQEQGKLVTADAEGRIRGAQGAFKSGRRGLQHFVAARMAVRIVDFLEAMEVQHNEAQRLAIAACAI